MCSHIWKHFLLILGLTVTAACSARVSDLEATFRNGQTFITWAESSGDQLGYRVYRAKVPLTSSEQLDKATLVAEVGDYTSLNLMASIKRIELSSEEEYEIPHRVYFVIEDGGAPLDDSNGLFVYTAKAEEAAYYAVTVVRDGVEERRLEPDRNALKKPVLERVEPVRPVLQNNRGDYVHWIDDVGTPNYPSMGSMPGLAYNFRLRIPDGEGPFPLVGLLHGALYQYNQQDFQEQPQREGDAEDQVAGLFLDLPLMRGQIRGLNLAPTPPASWYGYGANFGREDAGHPGEIRDFTVQRVLWTFRWARDHFAIDPDRIVIDGGSLGGIGAMTIGLLHPGEFSAIRTVVPPLDFEQMPWRPGAQRGGGRGGFGSLFPIVPARYVTEHPEREFPFIMITAGRTDHIVGWNDKLEFARAAEASKVGYLLNWHAGGHGGNGLPPNSSEVKLESKPLPFFDVTDLSRRQSFPAVANCTANDDPGSVDLAVHPSRRPPLDTEGAGDLIGTLNGYVRWDTGTIVDQTDRYSIDLRLLPLAARDEATADITPRRLQRFKPSRGGTYDYAVTTLEGKTLQSGTVVADAHGRLTVKEVQLKKAGTRLVITPARSATGAMLPLDEVSGVYCISADQPIDDWIWNLDITGVSIRTYWNKVEPERGQYDWSLLDQVVARGREHNKKVKLFVLFGIGVPEWTGATFIRGARDSEGDSAGARIPIPWDPVLIREKQRFIRVFAERYRDEPHVSFLHIAGPSAMWAELALPNNLTQVEDYSNEAILDAWRQIIDTWAEVRGDKRVSISVSAAPPFYEELGRDIVTYASGDPERLDERGVLNEAFLPQWCYLDTRFPHSIREVSALYRQKNPIGWQMWGTTVWPTRPCDDFHGTIDLAHEVGSSLVEIYQVDLIQPELARKAEELDAKIKRDVRARMRSQ